MSQVLGRGESRPWATKWPVSSLGAFLLAVVAGIGIFTYRNVEKWTPLQQWYWDRISDHEVVPQGARRLPTAGEGGRPRQATHGGRCRRGAGPMQGWPPFPFALTPKARQAGAVALKVDTVHYPSAQMHQMLSEWIYEGQSPDDLIRPAWFGALGIFVLGLVLAIPRDRARVRMLEHGRRLKGPQMVTVKEFNQWSGGNGIGFATTRAKRNALDSARVRDEPRDDYGRHGRGQMHPDPPVLMQMEERGETAIVYDPALEYTPQFFKPARGDVILNPLDERMPYWSPCDEVRHEAEAEDAGGGAVQGRSAQESLFRDGAAPNLRALADRAAEADAARAAGGSCATSDELAETLKDTEHAAAIYPDAGPQRGGVLARSTWWPNALKLLPRGERNEDKLDGGGMGASSGKGWLFLTSIPPEFRERLLPLTSLWLDMLVLRLMNQGDPASVRRGSCWTSWPACNGCRSCTRR